MSLAYEYLQKRVNFGKQPLFCEQGPEICDSVIPNPYEHKFFGLRNPVHQAIQNSPVFFSHEINTIRTEHSNSGINHGEGGWPKDININDIEQTQRYRRKVEKEDGYINCVNNCYPELEHNINQNNAVDLYETYHVTLPRLPPPEVISCRNVNIFRDPEKGKTRPINSISWQCHLGPCFAVTYVDIDFNRKPRGSTNCYIWSTEYSLEPELKITPPCVLLDLQFNIRESNLLAGGLINGQVAWWDKRAGSAAMGLCEAHVAHRDLVSRILFINSKAGTEFFSGSPDGVCKWWDTRNMKEPTDEIIIDIAKISTDVPQMPTANGISSMEYETTIPTRFMVGTENGLVISGNRKGKTQLEKLPTQFHAHLGPVWQLQRNPFFLKNFLTVGDWTARIWSEDCKESCILWTPAHQHRVTDGTWSHGRLSTFLLSDSSGLLSIWDILRNQQHPVLTMKICEDPLLKLRMHENSTLVACGSSNGNIYMTELSQTLAESGKQDKALLTAVFERESKRERILEARNREIRLKLKQAEEGTPVPSATDIDPTIGDRDLAEATAEFTSIVKKELAGMT